MRETEKADNPVAPTRYLNAQHAMTGVRGRDLFSTARLLARHSLHHPGHSLRHLLALGGQLGRIALGDTLYQVNPHDTRFSDPTWHANPLYKRSLQSYLAMQKQLNEWINNSQLSSDDRNRAQFLASLLSDALAPSNTLLNPLAIKELFNTGGASLAAGVRNLVQDWLHNDGMPRQVSHHAFEVGRNLATTPGAVVYRNQLLELIQYKSMSEHQYQRPLLIVPPQINKFYIFDLTTEKSLVQYCLKNDLQTFMISWRNPSPLQREWGLSSYVEATEQALEVCRKITGSRSVNLLGACAGGLTSAALQGHLQARRQLRKVSSATYLVSLLDSQTDSTAMLFADEQTLESAKRRSYQHGVLEGHEMARVFAWMRPNDLVWNYWVNNYLLGKQPPAFDILYWNNDNTRLPAALHGDLIDFFKYNPLPQPGAMEVCGTPVDLTKVTVDSFTVAGSNDHITPWQTVYRSSLLLGGQRRFVLANSGHIQSILNPPNTPKASFKEALELPREPQQWQASAAQHAGSWWPQWLQWLQERSGPRRDTSLSIGSTDYPPLEAAPGTYVHIR